jgi:hypothetical protein
MTDLSCEQKMIHSTSLDLMGVEKTRGDNGKLVFPIPHPLMHGSPPRLAPDGTHLWNPNWREPSTSAMNELFLKEVADVILDNERVSASTHR